MSARITILTAPAGAGKSRSLISRLKERLRAGEGRKALMLVPTAAAARAAVHSLLDGAAGVLAPPVAHFYEMVARILEHSRRSGREISSAERDLLIEGIIEKLASRKKIKYFAPLLGFRGFASSVGEFIKELKQNTIYPEQFLGYSRRGPAAKKGAELAAIYEEYQRVLKQAGLYDTEGRLWRVRDIIASGDRAPYNEVEEIYIDNFANFTPSEFDIVRAFAEHAKSITFALTHEDGPGRSELFETTSSTIALIEKAFPNAKKARLDAALRGASSPAILQDNIFNPLAGPVERPDDRIRIIRCHDRTAEVAETGRKIKTMLLDGRKAEEIVVVTRALETYAPLFEEIFREQGIPFSIAPGRRLGEIPAAKSVMHLLEIPAEDFSRHSVMRFLGSPYAPAIISGFDAAAVDRVSREAQVVSGTEQWLGRINSHISRLKDAAAHPDAGEDLPADNVVLNKNIAEAAAAENFMRDFITRMNDLQKEAAVAEYVRRVEKLIPWPCLRQACISAAHPEETGRDLAALTALRAHLGRLAALAGITGDSEEKITWRQFMDRLRRLLDSTVEAPRPKPDGRVRIMQVADTRGLFFPVVFVCGLAEKDFPLRIPQSPYYNDAARRELNRAGDVVLGERGAGQKFEMFLFYTAVTRATEALYLTHPMVDAEGREALPSYYLAEVERLFDALPVERISPGRVLPPREDAVSAREMLAAAMLDAAAAPAKFLPRCLKPLALRDSPPLKHVALSLRVADERDSFRPYGIFDGVLRDGKITKRLERQFRQSVFSASRLGEYGSCPFRYFTNRILGLEEIVEPEDELASVNRGKFFHAVLRDFFVILRNSGSTVITEDNREKAAKLLEELAEEHFAKMRRDGEVANETVFRAEQGEIMRILKAFVAAEAENNSEPTYFELAFGFDKPLEKWDAESKSEPLVIEGGAFPIRVRGIIDRVDISRDGLVVIDYKSGSSPTKANFINGSDLQLPLYAIALETIFAKRKAGVTDAFYYRLRELSEGGRFKSRGIKPPELYDVVKQYAVKHVEGMCDGVFPPEPRNDGACSYCAAHGICRYSEARAEKKAPEENDDESD